MKKKNEKLLCYSCLSEGKHTKAVTIGNGYAYCEECI